MTPMPGTLKAPLLSAPVPDESVPSLVSSLELSRPMKRMEPIVKVVDDVSPASTQSGDGGEGKAG